MYYNPETKEKLYRDELKNRLHASFPSDAEEVEGWFFLHNGIAPATEYGQSVAPGAIELVDGKYVQQYEVVGTPRPEPVSMEDRIQELEDALVELAEIIGGE